MHSDLTVRTKRSAYAFAFGVRNGVTSIWARSDRKTSLKAVTYFVLNKRDDSNVTAGATIFTLSVSPREDSRCYLDGGPDACRLREKPLLGRGSVT